MTKRLFVLALAVVAVFAFAAPSLGDTYRFRARGTGSSSSWEPTTRHAARGDRIVWKNPTSAGHNVVAYSRNWSKNTFLNPGERTSKRFRRAGRYKFRCDLRGHSHLTEDGVCHGMCGKVVVH
ncbi:MAG: cupredoxin domain-containing protein [Actinomycetota bacterium]